MNRSKGVLPAKNYFDKLYRHLSANAFEGRDADELIKAQQNGREALKKALRIDEIPFKKETLNVRVLQEEQPFDGYTLSRVAFEICDGLDCPLYILKPACADGPLSAVLCFAGHGYGSRDIVGLRPDGTAKDPNEDQGYQKNFAVQLVRRGFLVAAPDLIGFGDMRFDEEIALRPGAGSCHMMDSKLLLYDLNLVGLRVYQGMRVLDYLQSREDVLVQNIACMGISGGGTACTFLSALDLRIKAAVVSGYICPYRDSIMAMNHCIDNFPQGLLFAGEAYDIAACIAPRPLLMESGDKDPIFPRVGVEEANQRLRAVYHAFGKDENYQLDRFEGVHEISGAMCYDFLARHILG